MISLAITYGKHKINFLLELKKRKHLRISVKPDNSVFVSAPIGCAIKDIKRKLLSRVTWIIKQQEYFSNFFPKITPRTYTSGETHFYLGRQYRLKIVPVERQDVILKGKFIYIYTTNKESSAMNKELLYSWYKNKAHERFNQTLDQCMEKVGKYAVKRPNITIRLMKSRWGSCSFLKNSILLNTELIKAPTHSIEYVIMHELCHFKYQKHNAHFYHFLRLVMPDWEKRKARLEKTSL